MSEKRSTNGFTGVKIYWGWVVVAGAFVMAAVNYGARYSFGVFVKPMFIEYSWPMSIISLGASINIMFYALGGIFSGWLLDRMAPRWIMTCGTLVTSLGFVMTGFMKTPVNLFLSYGMLCGLGSAGIGVVVSSSSVGKWFDRKKGVATGIATMGVGFGTMVLAPVAGLITERYDWRTGFFILGFIVLIIGVAVSQLLMRRSNPEAYGLLPDGMKKTSAPSAHHRREDTSGKKVCSVIKDARYWMISIFFSIQAMLIMMVLVHQVTYAINVGIDKVTASASLGFIGISGLCGRFFFGWLSDRIKDTKWAAIMGVIIMTLSMLLLLNISSGTGLCFYALCFGFGYGSFTPLLPVIISEQFGRDILGSVYGSVNFFASGVGGAIGPMLGGYIYDKWGSYDYAWISGMVLLIGASLMMTLLKVTGTEKKLAEV